MNLTLALAAGLVLTLLANPIRAIDAPPAAIDLRTGLEPLATRFDAQAGQHRLLVLLSPA